MWTEIPSPEHQTRTHWHLSIVAPDCPPIEMALLFVACAPLPMAIELAALAKAPSWLAVAPPIAIEPSPDARAETVASLPAPSAVAPKPVGLRAFADGGAILHGRGSEIAQDRGHLRRWQPSGHQWPCYQRQDASALSPAL